MKEKCSNKNRDHKDKKRRKRQSSSSSESEWIEKDKTTKMNDAKREDWMSMTGMLKTYTKDDIKPKQDDKKHIDSYNPATSSRELNPYWKNGGTGVPQSPESFRKSKPFIKPTDDDENYYYSKSSTRDHKKYSNERLCSSSSYSPQSEQDDRRSSSNKRYDDSYTHRKSYNWKKGSDDKVIGNHSRDDVKHSQEPCVSQNSANEYSQTKEENKKDSLFLSDEKMNKLAAKIVKAEIMGDQKLVNELKAKLEAAREFRKQNLNAGEDNDGGIMLMSTDNMGNARPLTKNTHTDVKGKGEKRKAQTHASGERLKYFCNDDKYNLAQMFQQEKYGTNYDDEAQLAKVAAKHKNPNDDMEDIFVDEITKHKNTAKDDERERQRAINQHVKMEKTLEGCEYCVDSKNMLKHLMVSCGRKVYLAVPSRRSLVKGHCIITTIQHSTCVTAVDEDVWEEIMDYRKALTKFFNSQNKDVVFYETASRLHRFPHMVINCVPLPRDVGDVASIYFKKALLECEAEWSMNKKVVDLKGKNIRKGVPKGLPYFWIDFGMNPGFAHVIEDQQLFSKTFAEEIIAGILDLDHSSWKNTKQEYGDQQRRKALEFLREWKPFDTCNKSNEK